jgi:hypothetical protein
MKRRHVYQGCDLTEADLAQIKAAIESFDSIEHMDEGDASDRRDGVARTHGREGAPAAVALTDRAPKLFNIPRLINAREFRRLPGGPAAWGQ